MKGLSPLEVEKNGESEELQKKIDEQRAELTQLNQEITNLASDLATIQKELKKEKTEVTKKHYEKLELNITFEVLKEEKEKELIDLQKKIEKLIAIVEANENDILSSLNKLSKLKTKTNKVLEVVQQDVSLLNDELSTESKEELYIEHEEGENHKHHLCTVSEIDVQIEFLLQMKAAILEQNELSSVTT